MANLCTPTIAKHEAHRDQLNVADRLRNVAAQMPGAIAVACPQHWSPDYLLAVRTGESGARYATTTFAELDADAARLAGGLLAWGVPPGTRLALLVRPGIEFVTLVFALLRAGMVVVLVDRGLGRRNLIRCLRDAEPEGFVAVGLAQAARALLRHKFPRARWNVTIGRRWFWGGMTLAQLRTVGNQNNGSLPTSSLPAGYPLGSSSLPATHADDPAAIIFTSGSTGPPKGVLYTHRMFDTQVAEVQATYSIKPGGVDLACFPLFALFNSAMGVTTVMPEMDFSRPASADPRKLLAAAKDWQVTQAFASPAVWRVLGDFCAQIGARIETLRQVFSCGAPVPASVIAKTLACVAPGARMHTPYGATESLPVATIEAAEVLGETAAQTDAGAGVCVGRKFESIDWRVIPITDDPIATLDDVEELPLGEIGELIVRGPQVSPRYVTRLAANAESKIADDNGIWHRLGDVGYLDADGRFWYCGRKSHRVETATGTLFTECVEAIANVHRHVRQCALVGVGPRGRQTPVLIVEPTSEWTDSDRDEVLQRMHAYKQYASIDRILVVDWPLPVDVRHNAKINRERLTVWAANELKRSSPQSSVPSA
jgi:acyl-CoA synthetase (AMP-forming)/AMP-acid ligase II